jgi:hypothetical protein
MAQFKKEGEYGQDQTDGQTASSDMVAGLQSEVQELRDTVKALINQRQPSAAPVSNDLQDILKVILKREERLAKAEEAVLVAEQAKNAQRLKNMSRSKDEDLAPQRVCKHLKGGKGRKKNQAIDYAVYPHRFVDGTLRIRCTLCGAFWQKGDTVETLFRRGKAIPNHTKLGWKEAVMMVDQSTNKYSSSEIRFDVLRKNELEAGEGTHGIANVQ